MGQVQSRRRSTVALAAPTTTAQEAPAENQMEEDNQQAEADGGGSEDTFATSASPSTMLNLDAWTMVVPEFVESNSDEDTNFAAGLPAITVTGNIGDACSLLPRHSTFEDCELEKDQLPLVQHQFLNFPPS